MARPNRAAERRAQLVEVARAAVVERGIVDLRLRDVADRAGMSSGSVLYYFPSLAELLAEVQREAVDRFCVARERVARDHLDPRLRLLATIHSGLPAGPDDELCLLLYELGAVARRDPVYAARHIALYERQVAIYTAILEAGAATGVFDLVADPLSIARNLVTLEDGYGLHLTLAVPALDVAVAESAIRSYAATATRCALEDL
ncbi:TetR family transcriptional regulator [Solihabitans fulvus]|uniref:TetR family transcriptional regulator n=1 Tax=Solihabitans fulvus TaxID=1892852 RepID=A0A5B2XWU3_9PSEU|nr:TetR family transcriptional regulator C-terminal domain-containing protein [Solihabitans fulvus]KAA2267141.1 TetR family transcriptional regulator [Solihabitans fulvus]